jgi:hypothetical protein
MQSYVTCNPESVPKATENLRSVFLLEKPFRGSNENPESMYPSPVRNHQGFKAVKV